MTTSAFAWLDYSDGERRRMLEVIDLFREKGTVDEMGIGSIRDTFAERFFPAITTIQSRARYFLFVPWLYQILERDRIPSARAAAHARWLQGKLVDSLRAGGEGSSAGLIGIDAGANVQRPPSVTYWAGLRRLGILTFAGSTERYQTSLDSFYRGALRVTRSEGEELIERVQHNWNPSLPSAPDELLTATGFDLRFEDAEFLAEQIRHHAGESLLARCLSPAIRRVRSAKAVWDLGGLETLDEHLRQDIEDARRFALLIDGAVLTYNLMLAEAAELAGLRSDDALTTQFRAELAPWSDEMVANQEVLRTWDRPAMGARSIARLVSSGCAADRRALSKIRSGSTSGPRSRRRAPALARSTSGKATACPMIGFQLGGASGRLRSFSSSTCMFVRACSNGDGSS